LRLKVGTLDIIPATVKLITTSSPGAGIVPPDQFAGVAQDPAPASCHVFMAPNDKLFMKVRNINTNAPFRIRFRDIHLDFLIPFCLSDFNKGTTPGK
jgi:hypothetical protein